MKVFSSQLLSAVENIPLPTEFDPLGTNLVLVHGSRSAIESPDLVQKLSDAYPNAVIGGCSTAGEIQNGELFHNSVVFAAIDFESTKVKQVSQQPEPDAVYEAAREIGHQLQDEGLKAILIYCDGLSVDCDELMRGLREVVDSSVDLIGGLAADALDFNRTYVLNGDGAFTDMVVAIGLYGEELQVTSASSNFHQPGKQISITRSDSNMVYEINHKPAYEEYANTLGVEPDYLASGSIHHPIILKDDTGNQTVCRTVVEISVEDSSMIFAGSVPEGEACVVNFTDPDRFIEDATQVAKQATCSDTEFAVVINCAARRMALGYAVEDNEAAAIHNALGDGVSSIGFYAYGELGPCSTTGQVEMHNQTVTILSMHEVQA